MGGCHICNTYYYYTKEDTLCHDCNITALDRAAIIFTYDICSGELIDSSQGAPIGIGYSGFENNKNEICSISNPKTGVLPIGKYNVSDILCTFNNTGTYRVIKLQPLIKFSNWSIYDSFYDDLYIYPEPTESTLK